jgi:hypothetical protein
MELDRRARLAGGAGIVTGLVWMINWLYLLAVDADKVGDAKWYVGQVIAAAAILGTAVLAAGLAWTRAGGSGRFARFALATWAVSWLLLFIAAVLLIVTRDDEQILFPIGGILGTFAGLAGGIVVARAGVLNGWRRWIPLAFAIWYGFVVGAVMQVAEHSWIATASEFVAYALILLTGAALVTARLTYRVPVTVAAA